MTNPGSIASHDAKYNKDQICQERQVNMATGETSQAITPFHFFDQFLYIWYIISLRSYLHVPDKLVVPPGLPWQRVGFDLFMHHYLIL